MDQTEDHPTEPKPVICFCCHAVIARRVIRGRAILAVNTAGEWRDGVITCPCCGAPNRWRYHRLIVRKPAHA